MALVEDAATVLEEFVQNVANLPAEIQHLLEEMQAKDKIISGHQSQISTRDLAIQKFVKAHGCAEASPKEEAQCAVVLENYAKAQTLHEEKIALSERAALLLDRQVRRLDVKIRDLQNEGSMPADGQLPSLLSAAAGGPGTQPRVAQMTANPGTNGLLPAMSMTDSSTINGVSGTSYNTLSNAPLQRLVQPASHRQASPLTGSVSLNNLNKSMISSDASASASARLVRSPSAENTKRRRLNESGSTTFRRQSSLGPSASLANLPKSMNGNTMASGTNHISESLSGSSQEVTARGSSTASSHRPMQKKGSINGTTGLPNAMTTGDLTTMATASSPRANHLHASSANKKATARRGMNMGQASRQKSGTPVPSRERERDGSPDGHDEKTSSVGSGGPYLNTGIHNNVNNSNTNVVTSTGDNKDYETMNMDMVKGIARPKKGDSYHDVNAQNRAKSKHGDGFSIGKGHGIDNSNNENARNASNANNDDDNDEDDNDIDMDDDEGEGDDKKYCTCRSVSYGNMVACDNDDCPFEWFHWSCVGISGEPKGKWFCPTCRHKR